MNNFISNAISPVLPTLGNLLFLLAQCRETGEYMYNTGTCDCYQSYTAVFYAFILRKRGPFFSDHCLGWELFSLCCALTQGNCSMKKTQLNLQHLHEKGSHFEWTTKVSKFLNLNFIFFIQPEKYNGAPHLKGRRFLLSCQRVLLKAYGFPTVLFIALSATLLFVPAGSRNCQRFMKMKNGEWNIL